MEGYALTGVIAVGFASKQANTVNKRRLLTRHFLLAHNYKLPSTVDGLLQSLCKHVSSYYKRDRVSILN